MPQLHRGSSRESTSLRSYTLGFSNAFAAAWALVSLGHNRNRWCPRRAAMGHTPGRSRIHHRHVFAIAVALVGAAEDVRREVTGAARLDGTVGKG